MNSSDWGEGCLVCVCNEDVAKHGVSENNLNELSKILKWKKKRKRGIERLNNFDKVKQCVNGSGGWIRTQLFLSHLHSALKHSV